MSWDPTQPPHGTLLLSAPIRENFQALSPLMQGAGGTAAWPLLAPDGILAAPSYSFASDPTMGWFRNGAGQLAAQLANGARATLEGFADDVAWINLSTPTGYVYWGFDLVNGGYAASSQHIGIWPGDTEETWRFEPGGTLHPSVNNLYDLGDATHQIRDLYVAGQVLVDGVPLTSGMASPMTTAGDLIVGGASGTPTRLGIGTNAHILTLVAGVPTWAAPATPPAAAPAYPLLAPDGTVGAPSYSFTSATNSGMSYIGGLQVIAAGVRMMSFSGTSTYIDEGTLTIRDLTGGSATGASLSIDGTDLLAQRRTGANPQTFRLYNTYTDASNGEWLDWNWTGNTLWLRTRANGAGVAREILIPHGNGTTPAIRVLASVDTGLMLGSFNTSTALTRVSVGHIGTNDATAGTTRTLRISEVFQPTATSTMVAQGLYLAPTINYSNATPGAGSYEALKIAVTETALPTGQSYMIRASGGAAGTTDVWAVTNTGQVRGLPMSASTPTYSFLGGTDYGLTWNGSTQLILAAPAGGTLMLRANGANIFSIGDAALTGTWTLLSTGHLIIADNSRDIGTATNRLRSLYTGAGIYVTGIAAPATPATGQGVIYMDSADKKLKFKDDAGLVSALF